MAEFVNADLHEGEYLQHIADPQVRSEAARLWADARRADLLKTGQSFVSQTVFSHESNLAVTVRIADATVLYDSYAVAAGTHTAVAVCKKKWTQEKVALLAEWARVVLGK